MSHGGKREGAGRKPGNTVPRQFKIDKEILEKFLKAVPAYSRSKFVELALKNLLEIKEKYWK